MKRRLSIFLLLLTVACASVKKIIYSDDQLKVQLKQHIATLASDRFEGRETGTAGEKLAYEYIIRQFKAAGLKPKGTNGYLQEFTYTSGADFGLGTQLIVNNNIYEKEKDFYPLPYSSDGSVTGFVTRVGFGITDVQLNRDDYRGKVNIAKRIFLIQSGVPDGNDPHGKWNAWTDMRKKIDLAISQKNNLLEITFQDNGIGYDQNDKMMGQGILGIKERVALLKGTLTINSDENTGTSLLILIPILNS